MADGKQWQDVTIRALQEMVEKAFVAIGMIRPSEIRLMNKHPKDALADFMDTAEPVVAELTLRRQSEAQGYGPGEPLSTFGAPGYELETVGPDVAGADEGEPEKPGEDNYFAVTGVTMIQSVSGGMSEVADAQAPEPANERDEQMVVDNANKAADRLGMGKMSAVEEESLRRQYRRSGEPEDTDQAMGQALDEYNQTHPDADAEPEMCPQTKDGIRCSRELHNVGLHTPDGYPEAKSWTDKESDV